MTAEAREVELFVMVLGASNYTYSDATYAQKSPDFASATMSCALNAVGLNCDASIL